MSPTTSLSAALTLCCTALTQIVLSRAGISVCNRAPTLSKSNFLYCLCWLSVIFCVMAWAYVDVDKPNVCTFSEICGIDTTFFLHVHIDWNNLHILWRMWYHVWWHQTTSDRQQEPDWDTVLIKITITNSSFLCLRVLLCRDDGLLPDDVELVGSSITVQGPVEHRHAGLYECVVSYHHLKAMLQFNVTVNPRVIQPGRWNSLQAFPLWIHHVLNSQRSLQHSMAEHVCFHIFYRWMIWCLVGMCVVYRNKVINRT